MRTEILKVERLKGKELVTVLETPGWLLKAFGYRQQTRQFINSGREYMTDGYWMWNEFPSMKTFGRYEELDHYVRRMDFGIAINSQNKV